MAAVTVKVFWRRQRDAAVPAAAAVVSVVRVGMPPRVVGAFVALVVVLLARRLAGGQRGRLVADAAGGDVVYCKKGTGQISRG